MGNMCLTRCNKSEVASKRTIIKISHKDYDDPELNLLYKKVQKMEFFINAKKNTIILVFNCSEFGDTLVSKKYEVKEDQIDEA